MAFPRASRRRSRGDGGRTGLPAAADLNVNGIVDLDDVIAFVSGGLYDTGSYNTTPSGISLRGFDGDDPGPMAGGVVTRARDVAACGARDHTATVSGSAT